MDLRKLKTLIDLVSESGISELEITEAEGTVRIVKNYGGCANAGAPMQQPTQQFYAQPMPMAAGGGQAAAAPVAEAVPPAATGHTVKSPMVGTFYRAATPGGDPVCSMGQTVKIGDTLWSAVITYREESIRIISVRRSRTKEIDLYESKDF